jgi:glyoxylase-like metal-dependent hydrolase (beta-lactamase superfamily II)
MKIHKIIGNTYYFETKFAYMPFYKINENEIIMLDSGFYDIDEKVIQELILQYKFIVRAVICTHAHIDHVGNNFWLSENYNTEIIMPEYESMICNSMYNARAYYLPSITKRMEKRYVTNISKTDRKISDADKFIEVYGQKFEIVQLYGHTHYHIGIITPDNVFYVGDSLMGRDELKDTKIVYVDNIGVDLETKEKLRRIKCDKYILAHKGIYDDITSIIDDNINHLENQMKLIIDIINKPMTMSEIFQETFKKLEISKSVGTYILAEKMLRPYIYYLIDNGVIKIEVIDHSLKYNSNKHNAIE